jgi:hypothetical protein
MADIQLFAQDILYKRSGEKLSVSISEISGSTVIYSIPGDSAGIRFYLSCNELDSLRYKNGRSYYFGSETVSLPKSRSRILNRNNFSIDVVNLVSGKFSLEFEKILKSGETGFTAGILINLKDEINYDWGQWIFLRNSYTHPHFILFRAGVNFYPFAHSPEWNGISRLSTGVHLLGGTFAIPEWTYPEMTTRDISAFFLIWNIRERIYLGKNFHLFAACDISIIPIIRYVCPQAGLSLSF